MTKIKKFLTANPQAIALGVILVFATILRFYGITNQSLWLDELHTMNESDPGATWEEMFIMLLQAEPHPPGFFILERLLFTVFGYTDFVARSLSAVFGILSVYAIYLLGKELLNTSLGLIAALLTTINYYNIYYSQEARGYIMAALFVTLSYLYFVKTIKKTTWKNAAIYGVFTLFAIYSHYYAFFVLFSQTVIVILFLIYEDRNRWHFVKMFSISAAILIVGYLPWLPRVIGITQRNSFWLRTPDSSFAFSYFGDYFSNNQLLLPLIAVLLLYYCIRVFNEPKTSFIDIKNSPIKLGFLIIATGIVLTFLVPFIRSLVHTPMLLNRYTIVIVPLIILAIAFSIALIFDTSSRAIIICVFVALSLTDLWFVVKYYKKGTRLKSQFREMTAFISENKDLRFPLVEDITAWHHRYHLKLFNYPAPVLAGEKEATVDSILMSKSSQYHLDGFWIVGAHGDDRLEPAAQQKLEKEFNKVRARDFFDAWAELYLRKSKNDVAVIPIGFVGQTDNYYNATVVPIWGGAVVSQPVTINKGKYKVAITVMGTPAHDESPRLSIFIDDRLTGEITTTPFVFDYFELDTLRIDSDKNLTFKINLDNDLKDAEKGEDRNAFVKEITLRRLE